ncbi:hypothetical protein QJS04_geneDACA008495 [Acorus gramineus]|uniref:Transmembrane 9 superfamily member n=1 Tax=Acorus gramineus TaxID=55184 RepID=A0AAV9AIR6_ACOGR|nr:hypothetical protein QJS04_geneDACA008495 [Acorus gramineus]
MFSGGYRYSIGDHVPLYVNKVGPTKNPSETYQYYDLPFCRPEKMTRKFEWLGEVLNGDRLMDSLYRLNFREEKKDVALCKKILSIKEVESFRDAVKRDYYYQMCYDDLPVWGYIGRVSKSEMIIDEASREPHYLLFTHITFNVLYNQDQVIEVRVFSDPDRVVDITDEFKREVEFTYSVKWEPTSLSFTERMNRYWRDIQWLGNKDTHIPYLINSAVSIAFLMFSLGTVLIRAVKTDINSFRHTAIGEEDEEESGWKRISADVFRFPQHKASFCALVGTGTQLLTMVFIVIILAFVGVYHPYSRGTLFTSLLVGFALTSVVAGYTSCSLYIQLEGSRLVRDVLLTWFLFTSPVFATHAVLNMISAASNATSALPFGTIAVIILIWALITTPLLGLGYVFGKVLNPKFEPPCSTNKIPRPIPKIAWYRSTFFQFIGTGFLPLSAVSIVLPTIMQSIWGLKSLPVYGELFIMFVILAVISAFLSIVCTYFQLCGEDHDWWWRSVICGGSPAVFMFIYCCGYYFIGTDMSGLLQGSIYMGYTACACYALFLMLGTLSFRSTLCFVRYIYSASKCD